MYVYIWYNCVIFRLQIEFFMLFMCFVSLLRLSASLCHEIQFSSVCRPTHDSARELLVH